VRSPLVLALLLFSSLSLAAQTRINSSNSVHPAPNPFQGDQIFHQNCAACHGVDGRGHGPASLTLKHPAPNLTLIAQKNGGKFPFRHTRDVIAGAEPKPLLNDREMPLWGPIFHQVEADQDWGEVKLTSITNYVASIQQK